VTTKPWSEKPLWERVWLGPFSKVYLTAGKIIGHLGCSPADFLAAAKELPGYEQFRYENVARDLTVWEKREQQGRYELHATAKKVLRVLLGPAPDDPEYVKWWRGRLVSVEQMRRDGQAVDWAEAPPVPLPDENPAKEEPQPKAAGRSARGRRRRDDLMPSTERGPCGPEEDGGGPAGSGRPGDRAGSGGHDDRGGPGASGER
jgi:hypothetical protein